MGPQTREALRKYQSEHGLKTTGSPNQETMQQLGVAGQGAGAGSMGRGGHMGSGPSSRGGMGSSGGRSEEHTSELQSLMRISYAVFCLKKKKTCSNHN